MNASIRTLPCITRKPHPKLIGSAFLILIGLVSITSSSYLNAQEPSLRVEMFSFKPDGYVRVQNLRGATRVQTWNSQKVHIIAEKKSPSGGPLSSSELTLSSDENTISIESKRAGDPGRIDITVYMPHRSHLQVTGGEWPVEVTGSLASAVVETAGGNIAYHLPRSADARVAMHSARGSVRSTMALASYERAGARNIQGRLGRGSTPIILNSQSGDITLQPATDRPVIATVIDLPQRGASRQLPDRQARHQSSGQPIDWSRADQVDPSDPNSISIPPAQQPRGSSAPAAAGGQVPIASGGQSQQSDSVTQNGPFPGGRRERRDRSGGITAGVTIIDPDSKAGWPDNWRYKSTTPDDQQSSAPPRQPAPNPTSDQSDDSRDARADLPPMSGPRSIPEPRPNGTNSSSQPYDPPSRSSSRPYQTSAPLPDAGVDYPNAETASAPAGRGAPPTLRRENAGSPAVAKAGERASSPGSRGGDTIVLGTSVVNLNVSVTNRKGKSLPDIKKEDFQVFENGEPQNIEFFAPTTAPFNLVLLLDLSGSISDKLDVVKSAALHFIDQIGPEDRVAVLTFTRRVQVISPFTTDRNLLRQRIDSIDRASGGTAFYEAMWFALVNTLDGLHGQRNAIVVMTDGVDNSMEWFRFFPSQVSFEQLARRLEETDVIAFPIYIDTEEEEVWGRLTGTPMSYEMARSQLEHLAELTGGHMYKAKRSNDLSKVYGEIAAALRTIYSLGYYPTNQERDGTFRRVKVRVSRSEAVTRARKGYYAR